MKNALISVSLASTLSQLRTYNIFILLILITTLQMSPILSFHHIISRRGRLLQVSTPLINRYKSRLCSSQPKLSTVYVAVGSNVEPRFPSLQKATSMLSSLPSTKLIDTSFMYETKPMYVEDQPSFLNAAVKLETALEPGDLLDELKRIEVRRKGPLLGQSCEQRAERETQRR